MEMGPVIPKFHLVRGQHGLLGSNKTLEVELLAENLVDVTNGNVLEIRDWS